MLLTLKRNLRIRQHKEKQPIIQALLDGLFRWSQGQADIQTPSQTIHTNILT